MDTDYVFDTCTYIHYYYCIGSCEGDPAVAAPPGGLQPDRGGYRGQVGGRHYPHFQLAGWVFFYNLLVPLRVCEHVCMRACIRARVSECVHICALNKLLLFILSRKE